jgi:hypothetical protein
VRCCLRRAARGGPPPPSAALAITNVSADVFTERLNASVGTAGAGFSATGSITGLAAGASSNALRVALSTASAGTFSGTAGVSFDSSGAGTTGAADLALGSQSAALTGHVYTPAVAQTNTTVVDFGIVHRGDAVVDRNVSVSNTATASALNDTLRASLAAAPAGFSTGGTVASLAAGATDATSLRVGLNTVAAGVFAGSTTASFASHDGDLADLALGTATVALRGQVNNFAEVALAKSGGAGALSHAGNTWTLDFGTLALGGGGALASLGVLNSAIGPADLLSGSFDLGGVGNGFALSGFGSFSDLVAGASFDGLGVFLGDAAAGSFEATIVLHASGSNASGFFERLDDTTLVVRGDVAGAVAAVPEPETYLLMVAGLAVMTAVARRRRPGRCPPRRSAVLPG